MKKIYIVYIIINISLLLFFGIYIFKEEKINNNIIVEIKGNVIKPGLYTLPINSRVDDLIKLSGLKEDVNLDTINLSKKLTDGMVVFIYSNEDIENINDGINVVKYIEKDCICPKIANDACIETFYSNNSVSNDTGKISLNTASKDELMMIPGIGETKALAIIEYRNKTPFTSIEEIMNIKGIGSSTYEKIMDYLML